MAGPKVNRALRNHSKANDYRIVAFTIETPMGTEIGFEGCITKADAKKAVVMAIKIMEMTNKTISANGK